MNQLKQRKRFHFEMPNVFVTLTIILLIASAMTYLIPAGAYERVLSETGREIALADSFHYIAQQPVKIWMLPKIFVDTVCKNGPTLFPLMFISGGIQVVISTGMIHAICRKMTRVFAGKENIFILSFMLVFALIGITQGPGQFVGFAQLGAMIAISFGYDALIGVSIIMLAMNVGLATGIVEPGTAIAQQIAGLPIYSGMWLRVVSFVIFLAITMAYVSVYAKKIKADPTKSYVHGIQGGFQFDPNSIEVELTKKHIGVLVVFAASFVVLIYGCVKYSWSIATMGVVFLVMGVISGLVYGFGPSRVAEEYAKGMANMAPAAVIVGLGLTIGGVLSQAGVLDTVVHASAACLSYLPRILMAPALLVVNSLINFFVISGVGQASVVMPVMAPLCDIIGISRQVGVLAFKFGDGFSNSIYPSSSGLLIYLAATGIPYSKWLKYYGKLFCIQIAAGFVILIFAQLINYT